jgi:DNA-binding MarR family transcriptional regulator
MPKGNSSPDPSPWKIAAFGQSRGSPVYWRPRIVLASAIATTLMNRDAKRLPARAGSQTNTLSALTSIRRLVRVLRLASQRTQFTAGISAAQVFVLQQLRDDERLSLRDLAERTLTDRSSVAAVVERLHEQGLVDRDVDPADRRRAAVRITAAGRRVLSRASDAPTTTLLSALEALTPRQLADLALSLRRLVVALGASADPAPMLFAEDAANNHGHRHRTRASKRTG